MRSKLLPFFLFCSFYGVAQDSSFQIKDYKYRTPGFKALELNINFSGNFSQAGTGNASPAIGRNFQLMPSAVTYRRISSSDARLHQSSITLNPSLSFQSGSTNLWDHKLNRTVLNFAWDRSDRFYKNNHWFYEVGNLLSASLNNTNEKSLGTDYTDNNFRVENRFLLGIGKGRIEWVQDAQMALFILNDLAAQGLLNNTVTAELANTFAQLLTDINNKRVFDSRRRRIYELTRIDSFLQNSGLVTKTDIRHFTIVNDNWALAINPNRMSGSNWYFRVRPGFGYERSELNNKYRSSTDNWENVFYTLSPVLGYERYVPTSLKWQHNMGASITYSGQKNNGERHIVSPGGGFTLDGKNYFWNWSFNGFYGISFFPNNRTQLYSTVNLDAHYDNEASYLISPSLNFNMDYFLSYRTYLQAGVSVDYDHLELNSPVTGAQKQKNIYSQFSIGLTHMIF